MADNSRRSNGPPRGLLAAIGPGILLAATGVGAGDLATGALSGSRLGVAVLWAVVLGAVMKFTLNEGLTRWQLATGDTLLEGCARHFGRPILWLFLAYMIAWSFWVGTALMGACGVATHALLPLMDAESDKKLYGILHSAVALALVIRGGYRLFERVMSVCIAVMFLTVVTTAVLVRPEWSAVLKGLLAPSIPSADGQGLQWTIALMGGIGGTLTILCYGYWIREEGREDLRSMNTCRIDLAAGYLMTAVFGVGMVVLGSRISIGDQGGADLLVKLGATLQDHLGATARWAFLIGSWGAVASSLLGVWQAVPYLFADVWRLLQRDFERDRIDTRSPPYLIYLGCLASIPCAGLWMSFDMAQKVYAIVGAALMPLLAAALLVLNGQRRLVGKARNSWLTAALLAATMLFFLAAGYIEVRKRLKPPPPRVPPPVVANLR